MMADDEAANRLEFERIIRSANRSNLLLYNQLQIPGKDTTTLVDGWFRGFNLFEPKAIFDLLHLIVRFAGYSRDVPITLVSVAKYDESVEFLLQNFVRRTYDKKLSKLWDQKFRERLEDFFEKLFRKNWEYLFLNRLFKEYFFTLIVNLSDCSDSSYRYVATVICLKIVTGFVWTDAFDRMTTVVEEIFRKVYPLRCKDNLFVIRQFCLDELLTKWIRPSPTVFLRDEFLTHASHFFKDATTEGKKCALNFARDVLRITDYREELADFSELVSAEIPQLASHEDGKIVESVVEVALTLHAYFPETLVDKYPFVYEILFSKNRECAVAASKFFFVVCLENETTGIGQLKGVLSFLDTIPFANPEAYFVDAVMEKCKILTEWEAIVDSILGADLTKEQILRLIRILLYSAYYATTSRIAGAGRISKKSGPTRRSLQLAKSNLGKAIFPKIELLLDCVHVRDEMLAYSQLLKLVQLCGVENLKAPQSQFVARKNFLFCKRYNCMPLTCTAFHILHTTRHLTNRSMAASAVYSAVRCDNLEKDLLKPFQKYARLLFLNDDRDESLSSSDYYYDDERNRRKFVELFLKVLCVCRGGTTLAEQCVTVFRADFVIRDTPVGDMFFNKLKTYVAVLHTIWLCERMNHVDDARHPDESLIIDFVRNVSGAMLKYFDKIYFDCLRFLWMSTIDLARPHRLVYTTAVKENMANFVIGYLELDDVPAIQKRMVADQFFALIHKDCLPYDFLKPVLLRYLSYKNLLQHGLREYLPRYFQNDSVRMTRVIYDTLIDSYRSVFATTASTSPLRFLDRLKMFRKTSKLGYEMSAFLWERKADYQESVIKLHADVLSYASSSETGNHILIALAHTTHLLLPAGRTRVIDTVLQIDGAVRDNDACFFIYLNSFKSLPTRLPDWPFNYHRWDMKITSDLLDIVDVDEDEDEDEAAQEEEDDDDDEEEGEIDDDGSENQQRRDQSSTLDGSVPSETYSSVQELLDELEA